MSEAQPESFRMLFVGFLFFFVGRTMDLGKTNLPKQSMYIYHKNQHHLFFIVTGGLECGFGPFFDLILQNVVFFLGGGLRFPLKGSFQGDWFSFHLVNLSKSPNKEIQHPEKVFEITKGSLGFCHPHIRTIFRYHLLMGSGLEKDIKKCVDPF